MEWFLLNSLNYFVSSAQHSIFRMQNCKNRKYVTQTTKYSKVDNGKRITGILYWKPTENRLHFAFKRI